MSSSPISTPRGSNALLSSTNTKNPIFSRIYKILGTNYNDHATRDALHTLSEIYTVPSSQASLSSSAKGAQDGQGWEEDSDEESLERAEKRSSKNMAVASSGLTSSLSVSSHSDATSRARRDLKRDMETRLMLSSQKFLQAFSDVDKSLEGLQLRVNEMRLQCDKVENQVSSTNHSTKMVLEGAASLREERQDVEARKSIVTLFISHFTLTEEEEEAIVSRDVPIGPKFFAAMDKIERIREECRVLMTGEEGPTQAGLEIMAKTASNLEAGYEKVYRWCSLEFRQMGRDVQLEVSPLMRQSVRRLRQRPELLNEALSFLLQTRQTALQAAFLDALTRGGPSGLPRPIELHAHDPMRYVGDMLAWVHQAIAAEREFLEGLFDVRGDNRLIGSVRRFAQDSEEEEWIHELMDGAVAKLCVPLKARVNQTARSQESSIMAYKLASLLQYYMLIMRRTIGENAVLSKALNEITDLAFKVFYDSIEAQGRALLRVMLDGNSNEVTPPTTILDHAQILRELLSVYASSLVGSETGTEDDARTAAEGFKRVLDVLLDPAIEMADVAAAEKKRRQPAWDASVFVINCLTYLQGVMEPYPFTTEKQQFVKGVVDEKVEALIVEHFATVLQASSLNEIVTIINEHKQSEPLSHVPATSSSRLQSILRRFSNYLSSPELLSSPRLARLTAPGLHDRVQNAALVRLVKSYALVCDEVRKPANKYEAASTLLGSERPFGQVHLLEQILGVQELD